MKVLQALPEGFVQVFAADMKNNKKLALWLNVVGGVIALAMAIPAHFIVSILTLFDMEAGFGMYCLRFGVFIAANVAYIVIHELTHGAAMKLCGCGKLNFGFNGLFAWAGCKTAYFTKKQYVFIALAPLVLWGIVLTAVCVLVPREWFWVAYFVQIANVSGAVGDLYVSIKMPSLPRGTVVNDTGLGMTAWADVGQRA